MTQWEGQTGTLILGDLFLNIKLTHLLRAIYSSTSATYDVRVTVWGNGNKVVNTRNFANIGKQTNNIPACLIDPDFYF